MRIQEKSKDLSPKEYREQVV
ncbi:hypothetical protein ACQVTS_26165 [Bacillus mycoides]